jgi:uncharacterized membrane protein
MYLLVVSASNWSVYTIMQVGTPCMLEAVIHRIKIISVAVCSYSKIEVKIIVGLLLNSFDL